MPTDLATCDPVAAFNAQNHQAQVLPARLYGINRQKCINHGDAPRRLLAVMPLHRLTVEARTDHSNLLREAPPRVSEEVVWWYGGMLKGCPGEQPRVLVWLRGVLENELTDGFRSIRVPVAELAHFPIGSIWREGRSSASLKRDEVTFAVDYSAEGWEFVQPNGELASLIPPSKYPLYPGHRHDQAYLLKFRCLSGTDEVTLLVPCIEYFARMYGQSGHVRRAICTYPWHQAKDQLVRPLPPGSPTDKWAVNLHRRAVNADVVFLAHLLYDSFALQRTKMIWSQLEAVPSHKRREECFIRVFPWQTGSATLRTRGIWLQDGKAFLGLRITGASQPSGESVQRDRDNTNKVGAMADDSEAGRAWRKAIGNDQRRREIVEMTDTSLPQSDAGSAFVEDEAMEILGQPRVIIDVRRAVAKSVSAPASHASNAHVFSSDAPTGRGGVVGSANFIANHELDSLGLLLDVWRYLLELRATKPKKILSIHYMSASGSPCSGTQPALIPFAAFTREEMADRRLKNRQWPFLDVRLRVPRGALVVCVQTTSKTVYFLEIQRRPPSTKKDGKVGSEEAFKGLVFTAESPEAAFRYVSTIMREARFSQGAKLTELANPAGGVAHALVHRASSNETFPQETPIRRGFQLLSVDLD